MPISDSWPDVEASLEQLDEATSKRISSLHNHLLPYSTQISGYASSLHPQRLPCRLVTSSYTWGQSFLVYEIVFDNPDRGIDDDHEGRRYSEESWVARFGLPPYEGDELFNTPEQFERKILNEVGALRVVRERTTVPVPTIFGYCARHGDGFNQKFGGVTGDADENRRKPHPLGEAFPAFILMSALRGKTIEDCGIPVHELGGHWDAPPAADDAPYFTSSILQNYLNSLASIHMQLSQVTFPQIGSFTMDDETGEVRIGPMADFGLGPFDTAEEYYSTLAEAFKRLAENAQEDDDDQESDDEEDDSSIVLTVQHGKEKSTEVPLTGAQVRSLRRMFTAAIFPLALGPYVSPSNDKGPFPLRHGDLHSENILVDEDTGNIIGIIDWEGAGTVPWEVAGGLNWEVQGSAEPKLEVIDKKDREVLERPEIHSAFSRALKKVEADMSRWFRPAKKKFQLKMDKRKSSTSPPPAESVSPSASAISLSSSTSSFSELDSMKSHSRSSSSSKTNLTGFSSPPTSPASSMFELNKKESEDGENVVWTGPRRMPSIAILNTPPSPQKSANVDKEPKTDLMSLAKKFFRAASEPSSSNAPADTEVHKEGDTTLLQPPQHSRSVSLSPVVIEAIREPLPADYLKQMVNKSQISLSLAAMSITDGSPPAPLPHHHVRSPSGNNRLSITPTSNVFRTPQGSPSPITRTPRGTLHKRRQSSMVAPLGHSTPGGSPGQSPAIPPLHLYTPQPFPPPPLLAASLSLPPPIKRHGSPSPSGTPKEHMSRSSSPLATPHATIHNLHLPHTPHTPDSASHGPSAFSYGFPRTPTARSHNPHNHTRARTSWHEHEFGVICQGLSAHARPPSGSLFSVPLSRTTSSRGSESQKTVIATPPPAPTPTDSVVPAASPSSPPATSEVVVDSKLAVSPKPSVPEAPVRSPAGATLSELHASVGSYVASYLAHFMFMFGCEYDTVGKALWDVVLCSRKVDTQLMKDGAEGTKDVDDAFWAWVKETLKSGLEEGDEDAEEGEDKGTQEEETMAEEPAQSTVVSSMPEKHLDLSTMSAPHTTSDRVVATPRETLRDLAVDLTANKAVDKVD